MLGAIIFISLGLTYVQWRDNQALERTRRVDAQLGAVLSELQDAEIGSRGFLATGEAAFLEPLQHAKATLLPQLDSLTSLTATDPDQQAAVSQLRPLASAQLENVGRIVALRRDGDTKSGTMLATLHRGKAVMDQIRAQVAYLHGKESAKIAARQVRLRRDFIWIDISLSMGMLLVGVMTVIGLRNNARNFAAVESRNMQLARQAELLTDKELLIRRANDDLAETIKERTKALNESKLLLREVYHRVKNNLQIIESLLVIQSAGVSDSYVTEVFDDLRSRIHALGVIHDLLMRSDTLHNFDVAPFLEEVARTTVAAIGTHEVRIDVAAVSRLISFDAAVPLGLLLVEVLTNALKHAFPNGDGAISVALGPGEPGTMELSISDDGIGTGEQDPAAFARTGGLGMTIINGLAAQLDATMSIWSANGTHYRFVIPSPALT